MDANVDVKVDDKVSEKLDAKMDAKLNVKLDVKLDAKDGCKLGHTRCNNQRKSWRNWSTQYPWEVTFSFAPTYLPQLK
jgi:hypothetical protein